MSIGSIVGGGIVALLVGFLTDSVLLDVARRAGAIEEAHLLASLPTVVAMLLSLSFSMGASVTRELILVMVSSLICFASGIMAVRARLPTAIIGIASGLASFLILRKCFAMRNRNLQGTERQRNGVRNQAIVAYQKVNVDDLEQITEGLYSIRNTALFVKPSLLKTTIFAVLSLNDVDRGILIDSLERLPVNYAIIEMQDQGEYRSYVTLTSEGIFTRTSLEKAAAKVLSAANLLTLQGAKMVPPGEATNPITTWEMRK